MAFIKEEEKQLLLDRYLDIEWPDDVADLRCVHCQRVAINHHMSNCRHLFCHDCRGEWIDGGQFKCQQCHEYVTQLNDPDLDVEVKINKTRMFCPNKKYGCKYEDQLRKMPAHLITCVNTREAALPVDVTRTDTMDTVVKQLTNMNATIGELKDGIKEVKDKVEEKFSQLERKPDEMDSKPDTMISKIEKRSEDRNVELESTPKKCAEDVLTKMLLLEPMDHRTMEGVHSTEKKSEDTKVEVELASVKCMEEFQSIRSLLESMDHRIRHNELLVQTMVSDVGEIKTKMNSLSKKMSKQNDKVNELCEESKGLKAAQNTMAEKMEKTADRSKVTKADTKKMKSRLKSMRHKVASMTQQQETVQYKKPDELNVLKSETYEWTIKDVEKNILEDNSKYESDIFTFTGYKYHIKAKIEKKKGGIWIYLQFKHGDTINQSLSKYGFTGFRFIVRDQSNIQQEKNIILKSYLKYDTCFGHYDWLFGRWLPKEILSPPYTKDNCIKMRIELEPPSIDRSFVSSNGILTWRVDNYKTRKQEGWYYDIWSPSFYTSPQGYRVRTQLIISHSQRLEVAVYFLTGEHDDSLSIDYPHKTTITLYNHIDPSKNMVKTEPHKDVGYYTIQLESSTFIEDNGFVKDDSILLKVVIEPVLIG